MTYNVFCGTLNPTHFTSLTEAYTSLTAVLWVDLVIVFPFDHRQRLMQNILREWMSFVT